MNWDDDSDVIEGNALLDDRASDRQRSEHAFLLVLRGNSTGSIVAVGQEQVLGRGVQANMRLTDAGISRLHSRVFQQGGLIWVEDLGSTNGTRVNGELIESAIPLKDGDKIVVGGASLLKFSLQDDLGPEFHRNLNRAATRDPLTAVYNRQAFEDQLAIELAYAMRHGSTLSILLIEIDDFTAFTNRYGNLTGEYIVRALAERLQELVRQEDVVARCDGVTFGVACKATAPPEAASLARRILTDFGEREFSFENRPLSVSCSIGIAWSPAPGVTGAPSLLKTAVETLQASVTKGPGRLAIAPHEHLATLANDRL